VLDFLGAGDTIDAILAEYPTLTRKHVLEGIRFAAQLVDFEELDISA